jgi:hypothetical protein
MYGWRTRLVFFLLRNSFWTNYASYEYRNKSANKGAQLVLIRMPADFWNTWSPQTKHILSTRKLSIPLLSDSKYLCGLSEWCLTKYVSCFPFTRNLYSRVPFLFKKLLSIIWKSLHFNYCEELLHKVLKNHTFWCCQFQETFDNPYLTDTTSDLSWPSGFR